MKKFATIVLTASSVLLLQGRLIAAGPEDAEQRLREQLRSTMLQLRNSETEKANLQAQQTKLTEEKKTAEDQAAELRKSAAADKETINELNNKVTDKDAVIAQQKQDIEKLRGEYAKLSELQKKTEEARAKSAQEAVELKRTVADRESKNLELFQTGKEILSRYEKFSLGQAIAAREPFVGVTRVKLETLVQDYQDKLEDGRVKLSGSTAKKN